VKQSIPGRLLRTIVGRRGSIVAPLSPDWQREREVIAETRAKTELLLTDPAALHLMICARAARRIPGAFAEAGVFKGGSARLICEEKCDEPFHLFDVFETLQALPVPGAEEVASHFGKLHGSEAHVRRLLSPYPHVHFHVGMFPDTTAGLEEQRFSFVHIDLDLPSAMRASLEFFHPRLVAGGILVADDYCDPAVKESVDAWLAPHSDAIIELPWSQLMLVRQGG